MNTASAEIDWLLSAMEEHAKIIDEIDSRSVADFQFLNEFVCTPKNHPSQKVEEKNGHGDHNTASHNWYEFPHQGGCISMLLVTVLIEGVTNYADYLEKYSAWKGYEIC